MARTLTEEQRVMARERTRRFKLRHREKVLAEGRAYAERKRREAGMPALGSPESTANRRNARKLSGPEHGNWKGEGAGYMALHQWIARWGVKTGSCSQCGGATKHRDGRAGTDWANVSRRYLRDLEDWVELCKRCHRKFDGAALRHGTSTGYDHYGCRCVACRQAKTERQRDYLRRKREAVG